MTDDARYTAEQLAKLGGVSLRTVRYYVQEGLIDRPEARGPGGHFTDRHLRQLKQCQLLQDWGFDLETIRDKAGSLQPILDGVAMDTRIDPATMRALFRAMSPDDPTISTRQSEAMKAAIQALRGKRTKEKLETKSGLERIQMAEGIDIIVDRSAYGMPSPKELVDIALLIRRTFDAVKKPDDDPEDKND